MEPRVSESKSGHLSPLSHAGSWNYKSDSYIVWSLERVSYYGVKDLLPD